MKVHKEKPDTPDLDQARRHLTLLDEDAESFVFQTFDDDPERKNKTLTRVLYGTLDEHAVELIRLNRKGAGVFVAVNRSKGGRRRKVDITHARAVFREADALGLPQLPLASHFTIQTSPGKRHEYLLIEPTEDFDTWDRIMSRMVEAYGSDPNAKDRARVLRLAGFFHLKNPSEPHLVRIILEDGGLPYTLEHVARHITPAKKIKGPAAPIGETIMEGARNATLASLAGSMRQRGMSEAAILAALREENRRCRPPLEDEEVERIAKSIARYEPESLIDETSIMSAVEGLTLDSPTEDVEAIIKAATKNLKPVSRQRLYEAIKKATGLPLSAIRQEAASAFKEAEDEEPDHLDLARKTIDAIGPDNVISADAHIWLWDGTGVWRIVDDRRVKLEIHGVLESSAIDVTQNRVNGVLDVFQTETFKHGHVWNVHEETINVLNGELLLTPDGWRLNPHEREHYRTTQLPVSYDPKAGSPRFQQFMHEIFQADADGPDKAMALLEMIGYTLMSHARYERFILLVGNGANGKSILLAVIRLLVGATNCAAVQPSQFGNQFQRAHLHHKLANIVSELKEGAELDDDALKSIVSGEPTTVSKKFKDPFDMTPFATCWFGTNHLPHTNDFSDAMFRRALVVPFNRQFKPGVDADPLLKDKLAAELPGILNMALTAYAEAIRRGVFTEPASCIEAKHTWRLEADQAAQFAEDAIEWAEGERETSKAVFDAYIAWADANGVKRPLNHKNLTRRLERLGARAGKAHGGTRVLYGLRLRHGGASGAFSQPIAHAENTYIPQRTHISHASYKYSNDSEVAPLAPPMPPEDAETVLEVLE